MQRFKIHLDEDGKSPKTIESYVGDTSDFVTFLEAKGVDFNEGIEKGKEEGKTELLIKMLMKKFKKIPNEYKEKIKTLPEETIELIATDIFELNSIEELERYFQNQIDTRLTDDKNLVGANNLTEKFGEFSYKKYL